MSAIARGLFLLVPGRHLSCYGYTRCALPPAFTTRPELQSSFIDGTGIHSRLAPTTLSVWQ